MAHPTLSDNHLSYNVVDQGAGTNWGDLGCGAYPNGNMTLNQGAGNSSRTVTRTMAATIPINQQNAAAGNYSDTLTLTISY
jgi:spore coat protein U-like protein